MAPSGLFYRDMAKDITNDFDADGMCYVKISDDDGELYVTAKKYGGWHISSDKFASAWNLTTTIAIQQASRTSQPARSQTSRVENNYQRSLNKTHTSDLLENIQANSGGW